MKIGIKFKLVSFIATLLLVVILFLSFLILKGIADYQENETKGLLLNQKDMFEKYLSDKFSTMISTDKNNIQLNRGNLLNKPFLTTIPATIYSPEGKFVTYVGNESNSLKSTTTTEDSTYMKQVQNNKMVYVTKNDTMYCYSQLKYQNKAIAIIKLEYSLKTNINFYNTIKQLFINIGIIALFIGIALGSIYLIPLTNDIQKMIYSVKNIQLKSFNKIKKIDRNDELGVLSQGITFMSNTIEKNIIDLEKEKETLSQAVEKLKKLDKLQREFLNSVTHEFKTPLTSIKAYADIMQMYEYDPELMEEASENISKECERLSVMIDKILNISTLEKYDFELNNQKLQLKPLIEQICSRMTGKVRKNNLSLTHNVDDLCIFADEESIRHILINLIDNAIKYNSPEGSINVIGKNINGEACIQICDTGLGIPKNDLNKIFDPFFRVQDDRSRKSGGTGLGLAFVQKFVEKQNGRIMVESQENVGSKFILYFPEVSK